jgi:hypothetical protein
MIMAFLAVLALWPLWLPAILVMLGVGALLIAMMITAAIACIDAISEKLSFRKRR